MQTRRGSTFEVLCNMISGLIIANCTWLLIILPLAKTNGWEFYETRTGPIWAVNIVFTLVSIIRNYCWRRLFNWFELKGYVK